ncbi:MAG: hypothetical protein KF774_10480 [Planctomyces sp.]|nr:hypothetical protein [Planctomyces sp.]
MNRAIALSLLQVLITLPRVSAQESSAIESILDDYQSSIAEALATDPDGRFENYRQWSRRLLEAAIAHPDDPSTPKALRFALQASNMNAEVDFPIEVLRRLLPLRPDDPMLHAQLGSLLFKRCQATGSAEDGREAIESLTLGSSQLRELIENGKGDRQFDREQLVLNQIKIASIEAHQQYWKEAAAAYVAARSLTDEFGLSGARGLWGSEHEVLIRQQARALVQAGELAEADRVIDELITQPTVRDATIHLLPFAELRYAGDREGHKTCLESWAQRLTGPAQCRTLVEYARLCIQDQEYRRALEPLERLSTEFEELLLKLDAKAVPDGGPGTYSYVSLMLGDALAAIGGRDDEALASWKRIVAMYPNHKMAQYAQVRIDDATRRISHNAAVLQPSTEAASPRLNVIVALNLIAGCALAGIVIWRKRQAGHPRGDG